MANTHFQSTINAEGGLVVTGTATIDTIATSTASSTVINGTTLSVTNVLVGGVTISKTPAQLNALPTAGQIVTSAVTAPVICAVALALNQGSNVNYACAGITTVQGVVVTPKGATGVPENLAYTWTIGNAANKISVYSFKATATNDATLTVNTATVNVGLVAWGTA